MVLGSCICIELFNSFHLLSEHQSYKLLNLPIATFSILVQNIMKIFWNRFRCWYHFHFFWGPFAKNFEFHGGQISHNNWHALMIWRELKLFYDTNFIFYKNVIFVNLGRLRITRWFNTRLPLTIPLLNKIKTFFIKKHLEQVLVTNWH